MRKLEAICACEKMGIEPPIFLSIDRLDTRSKLDLRNAMRNYNNNIKQLRALLKEKISPLIQT